MLSWSNVMRLKRPSLPAWGGEGAGAGTRSASKDYVVLNAGGRGASLAVVLTFARRAPNRKLFLCRKEMAEKER